MHRIMSSRIFSNEEAEVNRSHPFLQIWNLRVRLCALPARDPRIKKCCVVRFVQIVESNASGLPDSFNWVVNPVGGHKNGKVNNREPRGGLDNKVVLSLQSF
jgi:hypothetical protein